MIWVKIEDKLPKPWVDVLVLFEHRKIRYILIGSLTPEFGLEAHGMLIDREEYQHKITHWMPLPNPPEE